MPESKGTAPAPRRGRLQLAALFLVFFVPVLIAWWLNMDYADWMPFGTTNYGELVRPPAQIGATGLHWRAGEPVSEGLLRERWTLLVVHDGPCEAACRQLLFDTYQIRRGLGKDLDRIQRLVVVTTSDALAGIESLRREQPDLRVVVAEGSWLGVELTLSRPVSGALFVVDPQGYVVLRYPLDADPGGLLDDLKRVLKISKIG